MIIHVPVEYFQAGTGTLNAKMLELLQLWCSINWTVFRLLSLCHSTYAYWIFHKRRWSKVYAWGKCSEALHLLLYIIRTFANMI